MKIFDRDQLRMNKSKSFDSFAQSAFLYEIALESIQTRLFLKPSYEKALFIGMRNLPEADNLINNPAIKDKIFADSSSEFLNDFIGQKVVIDEEVLPFAPNSFDLVVSLLNIHTINLVPEFLSQVANILKPGGVFIGSLFGSKTLPELKTAFVETEIKMGLASSLHVFPMTDVKEIANLAARCGFVEPVADNEVITGHYNNLNKLFSDLKNIGERNILHARSSRFLPRTFFNELEKTYSDKFSINENDGDFLPATFEIIYLTGFGQNSNQSN